MKCLNRIEMQCYIDNEFSSGKTAEIGNHLHNCDNCLKLFNEAGKEKQEIFDLLSYFDNEKAETTIPEFKVPKRKHTINRFQVLKIAASVIIIFGLYFSFYKKHEYNKKPVDSYSSKFESIDNSDPNKKWHKKQIEIVITDANGNIDEAFISEN